MKYLTVKTVAVSMIAATCGVIPAAGIASAAPGTSSSADAPVATNSTPRSFDLEAAKATAKAAIDQRLVSITRLQGSLQRVTHGECQAGAMGSQLTADSAGLTALKSEIDALPEGTTAKQFKVLSDQITRNYRIYMLQTPKTGVVVACDKVFNAAARLDAVAVKIQSNQPDADVSAITSHAQAARDAATKAVDGVIGLTADKGDASKAAGNKAALLQARSDLKTAVSELRAGRDAAKAFRG